MPDVWPSLRAYLTLFKAFQGFSASAKSSALRQVDPTNPGQFCFAVAESAHECLEQAVVRCVEQIEAKLGCQPDLCQLLIASNAPQPYLDSIQHAPAHVQQCFSQQGYKQPALIGGVVESLLSSAKHTNGPKTGVSLLAASLPDVSIYPFHTADTSLPGLPPGAWEKLLVPPGEGAAGHNAVGLLMAEPQFTMVDGLLQRLHGVLPWLSLLGGVGHAPAWGPHSLRGALFMGDRVYDSGAVGALMTGPVQLDALVAQGCRGVGPALTATQVHAGSTIMSLDGQPALSKFVDLVRLLDPSDWRLNKVMGVDATGTGSAWRTCMPVGMDPVTGSIKVSGGPVPEGSSVRLHVIDAPHAQSNLQSQAQQLVGRLPEHAAAKSPEQMAAMLFSCTGLTQENAHALSTLMPRVPFQGSKCQGEIGPVAGQMGSAMHQFSNCFGLLRHSSLQKAMT